MARNGRVSNGLAPPDHENVARRPRAWAGGGTIIGSGETPPRRRSTQRLAPRATAHARADADCVATFGTSMPTIGAMAMPPLTIVAAPATAPSEDAGSIVTRASRQG